MAQYAKLTDIKKELMKAIKYEDNVTVRVAVYDCTDGGVQTYDVEIMCYADGEYIDTFVPDAFEDGELKEAQKRAKSVLKTVKGWFEYSDVTVENVGNEVEVYHV